MHTLHLIHVEDGNALLRVRAVRAAMRALDPEPESVKATHADRAIRQARDEGSSLLGRSDSMSLLIDLAAALETNGCLARVNYPERLRDERSPEEVFAEEAAELDEGSEPIPPPVSGPAVHDAQPDAERPQFSAEAYETAMALIVALDGKPFLAAAHARTLGRTTGDDDLYLETINAILYTFPWIKEPLAANGIVVFDQ
jgi:hypothetical protein